MRIVVLLKAARSEPQHEPQASALDASARSALAHAIALARAARDGATVTALCAGPPAEEAILELALRAGAQRAVRLWCSTGETEPAVSHNVRAVGELLAAGARHLGFDLILAGSRSPGWASGIVGPSVAFELGIPHVTEIVEIAQDGAPDNALLATQHRGERHARLVVELPALLMVRAGPPLVAQKPRPRGEDDVETLFCSQVGFEPDDPLPWPTLRTERIATRRVQLDADSRELFDRLQGLGLLPGPARPSTDD